MMKNRNMRRMLSVLLILAMLLPTISMTAFSQDLPCVEDGCSGKYRNGICSASGHYEAAPVEAGVYKISNAGQLYWFAALVNSGDDDCDAALTADITINADMTAEEKRSWTPIGLYTSAREYVSYAGTFDGQNHTVSGLYYNDPSASYIGLFGYVYGGTVTNTGIENSYLSGSLQVGAIAGYTWSATITNCYNAGTVVGCESEYSGGIGGVVGSTYGSNTVSDCYNSGTVTSVSGSVGGIVGQCGNQTGTAEIVTRCYNIGSVSGTECYTGGVVGMIRNKATISYCYNAGTVTHTGTGGAYYGTKASVNYAADLRRDVYGKIQKFSLYRKLHHNPQRKYSRPFLWRFLRQGQT